VQALSVKNKISTNVKVIRSVAVPRGVDAAGGGGGGEGGMSKAGRLSGVGVSTEEYHELLTRLTYMENETKEAEESVQELSERLHVVEGELADQKGELDAAVADKEEVEGQLRDSQKKEWQSAARADTLQAELGALQRKHACQTTELHHVRDTEATLAHEAAALLGALDRYAAYASKQRQDLESRIAAQETFKVQTSQACADIDGVVTKLAADVAQASLEWSAKETERSASSHDFQARHLSGVTTMRGALEKLPALLQRRVQQFEEVQQKHNAELMDNAAQFPAVLTSLSKSLADTHAHFLSRAALDTSEIRAATNHHADYVSKWSDELAQLKEEQVGREEERQKTFATTLTTLTNTATEGQGLHLQVQDQMEEDMQHLIAQHQDIQKEAIKSLVEELESSLNAKMKLFVDSTETSLRQFRSMKQQRVLGAEKVHLDMTHGIDTVTELQRTSRQSHMQALDACCQKTAQVAQEACPALVRKCDQHLQALSESHRMHGEQMADITNTHTDTIVEQAKEHTTRIATAFDAAKGHVDDTVSSLDDEHAGLRKAVDTLDTTTTAFSTQCSDLSQDALTRHAATGAQYQESCKSVLGVAHDFADTKVRTKEPVPAILPHETIGFSRDITRSSPAETFSSIRSIIVDV
jgi:chromosome segregation ATPase